MEPAAGTAEGLMCDTSGRLIEGIRSNVFLVRGDRLLTPDLADRDAPKLRCLRAFLAQGANDH